MFQHVSFKCLIHQNEWLNGKFNQKTNKLINTELFQYKYTHRAWLHVMQLARHEIGVFALICITKIWLMTVFSIIEINSK